MGGPGGESQKGNIPPQALRKPHDLERDICRLVIHADLLPARTPSARASHDRMLQELQEILRPLQYTMSQEEYTLTILIPLSENLP